MISSSRRISLPSPSCGSRRLVGGDALLLAHEIGDGAGLDRSFME